MRPIDADKLVRDHGFFIEDEDGFPTCVVCETDIRHYPTIDAAVIPCKIGDFVWAIRNYNGFPHPQQGKVAEMYFTADMRLHIVVSHIARGEWGKTVFPTFEEANKAISERCNPCSYGERRSE